MTKNDLIKELAVSQKLPISSAAMAVDAIIKIVKESLAKGENLYLRGFGSLCLIDCAEKTARNISTGETIIVPPHKSVKFKPSKELKNFINNGYLV